MYHISCHCNNISQFNLNNDRCCGKNAMYYSLSQVTELSHFDNFYKNTHTWERSWWKLGKMHDTLSFFFLEKFTGLKIYFLWRFITGNVDIFFSILKSLAWNTFTIFQFKCYHPCTLINVYSVLQCKIHIDIILKLCI